MSSTSQIFCLFPDKVPEPVSGLLIFQGKVDAVLLRRGGERLDILVRDLNVGNAGVVLHKLPERLLAVPELRIFLVLLHIHHS